jgi:hypothetical protein
VNSTCAELSSCLRKHQSVLIAEKFMEILKSGGSGNTGDRKHSSSRLGYNMIIVV